MVNDPYYLQGYQWGLKAIHAEEGWSICQGDPSIKIAVLDSGISSTHPDLIGKVVGGANFTPSDTLEDLYGHGTPIAGVAAANTNNGIGIAGVSYNCSLLNVKVTEDLGWVYVSRVIQGIRWAADNGAHVITMSFAGVGNTQELKDAVDYAWSKGCVLIHSAGNDNSDSPKYPGAYDNVLAVAGIAYSGNKEINSSYGTWVNVAAPGASIWSTIPGDRYGYTEGTSFAAPFVAGLAALMFAKGMTNQQIFDTIISSADQVGGIWTDCGIPLINCFKALGGIEEPPAPEPTPEPTPSPTPEPTPIPTPDPTPTPAPTPAPKPNKGKGKGHNK